MKKIMNFAAALAVVLPVSCNKEMTMPQGDTLVGKNVKVTMNATIDDPATKLLLDNNLFKWEAGDQVNLRWANVPSNTNRPSASSYEAVKVSS